MTDCPRKNKLFRGCKFKPRYDVSACVNPAIEGRASPEALGALLEKYRSKTYVTDVCVRCGRTTESTSTVTAVSEVPGGRQLLVWEPMYGWLVGTWDSFGCGKWQIKSTGNFYFELPAELEITHYAALPPSPKKEDAP